MRKIVGLALALSFCARVCAEDAFVELKRGDKGDGVRSLQDRLEYLGY